MLNAFHVFNWIARAVVRLVIHLIWLELQGKTSVLLEILLMWLHLFRWGSSCLIYQPVSLVFFVVNCRILLGYGGISAFYSIFNIFVSVWNLRYVGAFFNLKFAPRIENTFKGFLQPTNSLLMIWCCKYFRRFKAIDICWTLDVFKELFLCSNDRRHNFDVPVTTFNQ